MNVRIGCSEVTPELDAVVYAGSKLLVLSYFDRSLQDCKAFSAAFQLYNENEQGYLHIRFGNEVLYARTKKSLGECGKYQASFTKRQGNKDAFYHAVLEYSEIGIGKEYFISKKGEEGTNLYNHLMETGEWPLLPEWGEELFKTLLERRLIERWDVEVKGAGYSQLIKEHIFDDCVLVKADNAALNSCFGEVLENLIRRRRIEVCSEARGQKPLKIPDLDAYYERYGSASVSNLEAQLKPLTPLSGNIEGVALKGMRLYPQQITMVNGITALLSGKKSAGKSRYCFVNLGCGTGKTIISLAACEKYHIDRYLRLHPEKTLSDVYSDPEAVSYRTVIICPGHMVEKWKREAENQVPFAKAEIIDELWQLVKVKEIGKPHGKEILVMSKDFAKYTYAMQPVPHARTKGEVRQKECESCGKVYQNAGDICPECGHKGYRLHMTDRWGREEGKLYDAVGMKCPRCGKVLLPYHTIGANDKDRLASLDYDKFDNKRTENSLCYWCNEPLWEPYVRNREASAFADEEDRMSRREPYWKRISVYANAKMEAKKSLWAHKRYQAGLIAQALNEKKDNDGLRKYSPAQYIKRYMKGCVDFLIADECHQYKNTSGQGEAFSALAKVAKRTLGLTGTLTGGKAEDLFYPLYRLDPARMQKLGFRFGDAAAFSYRYGNVRKTKYYGEGEEGAENGITTRGRNVRSTVKIEPGISPLIFTEFLLDRAVFLDLDDMSGHLPPLSERVISVSPENSTEKSMYEDYKEVIEQLSKKVKDDSREFGLMGDMLQFSLSWLDKPYTEGKTAFISPYSGDAAAAYPQYEMYRDPKMLTTKEKALIDTVKKELSEDRRCFIFLEYTNQEDTNCSDRLQKILTDAVGERVEILRSSSPEAAKREEYIHRLAEEGVRVIITNPRCCETGVDFIFRGSDGNEYNYPTLVFYQLGYSLFTAQQASRRHYRLIQNRECRTYYMCWKGTAQEKVIGIISRKMVAASAIQGHFSTEGLMSMAEGVDARVELARSLSEKDTTSGANLQEMFDVLKGDRENPGSDDSGWEPMKLLKEVVDEKTYTELFVPKKAEVFSISDVLEEDDEDFFGESLELGDLDMELFG